MAVNRLCAAFRHITIRGESNFIRRYCSTQISQEQNNIPSYPNFSTNLLHVTPPGEHIKFAPRTLNIDFGNPVNVTRNNINELPLSKYIPSMEEPLIPRPIQQDLPVDKTFELPSLENVLEKLAIRLIVIRRRKMKKHKRRKLRKRMKFVWARIRDKRNVLKEKLFQAELVAKIKEAQKFDAKAYVESRLAILDKERLPKSYKGEIIHPDMIRKFLQEDKEKREKWLNRPRLTLD